MLGRKTHFKDWLLHTGRLGHKMSCWCHLSNEVGRLFAPSAKKLSDATTKDSHSYFSMLKAKVTKHWQMKYSVAPKWFLHPLN